MNPDMLVLVLGLFYALVFCVLSTLEREGISGQFILEVFIVTASIAAGSYLSGSSVNPLLFLIFMYLVTMRSRLLADLANWLSKRGNHRLAISILEVAQRLLPDKPTRLITDLNMGIVQLRLQNPEAAETLFESVLEKIEGVGLGIRNRTACQYYLGLTLLQRGKVSQAKRQLRAAIKSYPTSPYGKAAAKVLDEYRKEDQKSTKKSGKRSDK